MRRFLTAASALALALALVPLQARAGSLPIVVYLSAPVSEGAKAAIPADLWTKIVTGWVDARRTIVATGDPTVEACRAAGAGYLVVAPFGLASQLPGTPVAADRKTARSHVVVTSCTTGAPIFDRAIALESDPLSVANAGDYEPVYEVTWNKAVRATLAREYIPFPQVASVARVEAPYVFLDLPRRDGLSVGEVVHVRAPGQDAARKPVDVQITDVSGRYVQAQLVSPRDRVNVGDVVESTTAPPAPANGSRG